MKYQYILNEKIVFETNDVKEYIDFILKDSQLSTAVITDLLSKSDSYKCKMANC